MDYIDIIINGVKYKLKKSFRGLMLFEEMTGTPVTEMQENTGNMLKMFYCLLKGANKDIFILTWDEFIDYLDTNEDIVQDFNNYMVSLATPQPEQKKTIKKKL